MRTPHLRPPVWPATDPARWAASIRTDTPAGAAAVLVGLPDDLGVRLNHGRPGAAEGPAAFRAALARFGSAHDLATGVALPVVFDLGDVVPASGDDAQALAQTHDRVTAALVEAHRAGLPVVCIGGGHDLTFASVRALSQAAGGAVGGVNVDPHLDVRETIGSGMPFRQLIEQGLLNPASHTTLGVGRFANSQAHVHYARARGVTLVDAGALAHQPVAHLRTALDRAALGTRGVFVSFDLDSIDAAHAPGVSALNPCGLPVRDAAAMCEVAGADPRVRHFDLMELCPAHDEQGRTARVAAMLFLSFLSGLSRRGRS